MPSRDDYCPVAKAADDLGDRWSLLVLREMFRGVRRFNELQRSVPGISRSVLAQRLRHLERAGVIERLPDATGVPEYRPTEAGWSAVGIVDAYGSWGTRWRVPDPRGGEVDPDGLMMWIRRHVVLDLIPPGNTVVEFELRRPGVHRYWLVLRPDEASLCPADPGFGQALLVRADTAALYRTFAGRIALRDAIDDGLIQLVGPRAAIGLFPRWFHLMTEQPQAFEPATR